MNDVHVLFLIIAVVIVLFITEKVPVVIVALGTALALYFTGILDFRQALGGLGDPTTIFIASLFVVSAGLEVTGVTAWAGQFLIDKAGESRVRQLVLIMMACAALTGLISLNGAVAALLPVVVVMAVRLNRPPSQLLMPMVFASHAGSILALTGSPVNVLVSQASEEAGTGYFGFFEFAIVGVPLLAGTMAILVFLGHRLLPHKSGASMPTDLSKHARTLVEQYRLEGNAFQLRVRPSSPLIGTAPTAIDLSAYPGLSLIGSQAGATGRPLTRAAIEEGDTLILRGEADAAASFANDQHLAFGAGEAEAGVADTLFNRSSGLAEVVIPPRSGMIGREVFPGMVTESGDLLILAVQRRGEDVGPGKTKLEVGDTMLLQGTWSALDKRLADPEVLVVDSPDLVRRQAVPMGAGAKAAIGILVAMVVALALNLVPSAVAGMVAAVAMVLVGVLTVDQAYRSVNWTTVILVGAMTPLSAAMTETGAAQLLADKLVSIVGEAGPYALLAGLFILTAVLGQLISNTATALIIIPIAVAAALELGISPRPVMMSVCVAAAASFLTPVATPVNLMIMGPGGYKFGDYWKIGIVCMAWFFIMAVFFVPMIWRF
ncbi:MAG TPA: SLC13 family permease [Burkholderiaceae bacterium]|nr:SLC13 family permease [Burkholderiaceae bacterium]HQR78110.1 SLC13 family permease [Burkholderiaceae bacterium]